ncbi:hypothetical protein [Azospirillum sp. HJ39]|uniref:hypothetical protein n=1 Tax=Azospirillum sp. HJ39 TaxID=3159496 RepID=UPI003555D513
MHGVSEWIAEHRHSTPDILLITRHCSKVMRGIFMNVELGVILRSNRNLGFSKSYRRFVGDDVPSAMALPASPACPARLSSRSLPFPPYPETARHDPQHRPADRGDGAAAESRRRLSVGSGADLPQHRAAYDRGGL